MDTSVFQTEFEFTLPCGFLEQQDSDSISFLTGRTANRPDTDALFLIIPIALEEEWDHLFRKCFPGFAIPEKVRDSDQDVIEHRLGFRGISAEICQIGFQGGKTVQLHAPLHTAQNGRALILGKVVPGASVNLCQNAVQYLHLRFGELTGVVRQFGMMLDVVCEFFS